MAPIVKKEEPVSRGLKKEEAQMELLVSIVEYSGDAIISKSLDGTIKSWNRASENLFGYSAEEAIGQNISLIFPPENLNENKEILEKVRNNEIIDHYEAIRIKKNGEQFYVSITISPLKDRTGNIIGACKIARDITAKKQSESEYMQATQKLIFQNEEKKRNAEELIIVNNELAFQNEEKEKRSGELVIANKELAFQASEKEKRSAELVIANKELAFQN